jgi:hypothetical protein
VSGFRAGLEKACDYDVWGLTFNDIEAGLASGVYLAVSDGRQVVIVEQRAVRGGKALSIAALAGAGLEAWLDGLCAFLQALARDQGCRVILAHGRPGWARQLKRQGYQRRAVTMVREVDG